MATPNRPTASPARNSILRAASTTTGGRYYDQNIGRFISPDPFVQQPDDPQNLNRYSYVLNNPQGYIDPSGYFWEGIGDFFSSFFSSFTGGSYQSQVSQAQQNNLFMAQTFGSYDNCNAGTCGGSYANIELRKNACEVCELLELPQNAALRDTMARREYTRPIEDSIPPWEVFGMAGAIKSGVSAGIRAIGTGALKSAGPGNLASKLLNSNVHKNSLEYVGDTHVYAIRGPDGSAYKIGMSAQGTRPIDGLSNRAEQQVRKLIREDGSGYRSQIR